MTSTAFNGEAIYIFYFAIARPLNRFDTQGLILQAKSMAKSVRLAWILTELC